MTNDTQTRTASIPFSGFYESSHDAALDQALEQMFSDDSGCERTPSYDIASDAIDWRAAHLAYAQEYAKNLALETESTWQFAKLDSPRFYNYRTNEIDVTLSLSELQRMRDYVAAEHESAWLELCRDRLTARDGFIPFYDSNPYTWGTLDTWESPQLSLLVECYVVAKLGETESDVQWWLNYECVEDCNGDITRCIESAIPQAAWDKINAMENVA
jgi:hypothetical protein